MKTIADSQERELAAATFDRNVVVTAGAGTGKTTLLVDRLLHLLVRYPDPLKITEIIALTFTNKAADEMKSRLRERLHALLVVRFDRGVEKESEQMIQTQLRSLMDRYHRTRDQILTLVREALRTIERGAIGTVHSFAAMLLRLYPMEAGLDPQFAEDDGSRFEQLFKEQWALWLDQELSRAGKQKEQWKQILRRISLEDLRALAFCLAAETIPLEDLSRLVQDARVPEVVSSWLRTLATNGRELLRERSEDARQIAALSRLAVKAVKAVLERGVVGKSLSAAESEFLATKSASPVQGWSTGEVHQARELVRVARRLLQVDHDLLRLLGKVMIPFVQGCRQALISQGFVSFDGLLVRARDLVRHHPRVREELKQQFKAILIDEFQDTDPIQYEILLFLAEQLGQSASAWQAVKLAQGKLFIVGDPKQSIYAFRRADIEAYLHVVQKMIARQGGVEYHLKTNFRSHRAILDVVNGVFERLIVPRAGLQPPYSTIHPAEDDPADKNRATFRKVALRKISGGETASADLARRLEAESLARWLEAEVLGKATILNRAREEVVVQPRDIAFLLRKLTDVHVYLEPLRRRGIPYVVEGERHFYATQEIVDAVNLLRTVENPYDRAALVGVLRSAVGGLNDADLYELNAQNLLDYRSNGPKLPSTVRELYSALRALHSETRDVPVGEAVNCVFDRIPLQVLAALSFSGEQAVANLEKIRQLAEKMGREGAATLKEVIARLQSSVLDLKEEGESALAEEGVNAVHILSVHKAKGLEFPVVVLAGSHSPVDHREPRIAVQHDWSSNLVGLNVADVWSLPGIYLAEKNHQRSLEEQKRVFYVAMTRAREHLTLSCSVGPKQNAGTFLAMLADVLGQPVAETGSGFLTIDNGRIEAQTIAEALSPPKPRKKHAASALSASEWEAYARFWEKRKAEYARAQDHRLFETPTSLKLKEEEFAESLTAPERADSSDHALLVGNLAHRFLEAWEFPADWNSFKDKLARFLEPLPDSALTVHRATVLAELEEIFLAFFSSPIHTELSSARILGREVPFLIPWDGQIMEGIIDLIYERKGHLYLADYKTDQIKKENILQQAQEYHHQAQIYTRAARQCLGREVASFRLIFLRLGEAVDVVLNQGSLQYTLPL